MTTVQQVPIRKHRRFSRDPLPTAVRGTEYRKLYAAARI